jgi:hypothetical protein
LVGLCEHGQECHLGVASASADAAASAPERSRSWLLIEHSGPWAAEELETAGLPPLGRDAVARGIRVQLIRRRGEASTRVYAAWTAGPSAWAGEFTGDLDALAAGSELAIAEPAEPLFLVCTHGRRDACCGRYGGALARALTDRGYPVWETTHVGGHRFAANLVILPHGLYYGPVSADGASAAIDAYRRGMVLADRYRGRAGLPASEQAAEIAELSAAGSLALRDAAVTMP